MVNKEATIIEFRIDHWPFTTDDKSSERTSEWHNRRWVAKQMVTYKKIF